MIQHYEEDPVLTAEALLNERWRRNSPPPVLPPDRVILCYQPSLVEYARRKYAVQRVTGFFGELYLFKKSGGTVALAGNFGIGAPAAVIQLEELIAFGAVQFISIGLAGSLQPGIRSGEWLIYTGAFRDEGTSHHYLPPGEDVAASQDLSVELETWISAQGYTIHKGQVWTTDAPFRETRQEIVKWQQAGACAVEMEAAALFAAGRALGVETAAAATIADQVLADGWHPMSNPIAVQKRLQMLLDRVIEFWFQQ